MAVSSMAVLAMTTSAFSQSGEFLKPPDAADDGSGDGGEGGIEMIQLVPGMSNDTLAFVALVVLFGLGLIAIWARGQIMHVEQEQNSLMLARSAAKQPNANGGAAAEQAAIEAQANRDPSVTEAIAKRLHNNPAE